MRLRVTGGNVVVEDVPATLAPTMAKRFGAVQVAAAAFTLPPKMSLAFRSHYRAALAVEDSFENWLGRQFSPGAIFPRLHPATLEYRGGYQARIIDHAVRLRTHGALLYAGAGKSLIALEIARMTGPTLIITTPQVFASAYVEDLRKFYSGDFRDAAGRPIRLRVSVALGDDRSVASRRAALRRAADVYFVSPFIIGGRGVLPELLNLPLAGVEVDESTYFRDEDAVKVRALQELGARAEQRHILTAGISPNDVSELWTQMDFLRPGEFGTKTQFCSRYGQRDFRGRWTFPDEAKRIAALEAIRPWVTWLGPRELWPDAPAQTFVSVPVELGPEQRTHYDSMDADLRMRHDGREVEVFDEMAQGMKLRELTAGFIYDSDGAVITLPANAKLQALRELVRRRFISPAGIEPFVVWVEFREEFEMLRRAFAAWRIPAGELHGSSRASLAALADFRAGKLAALVSHPRGAAHGIRLDTCRNQVWFSLTYDADEWQQALSRTWRPPQRHECRYFVLQARNTIDERIYAVLQGKESWRALQESVLGGSANDETEFVRSVGATA